MPAHATAPAGCRPGNEVIMGFRTGTRKVDPFRGRAAPARRGPEPECLPRGWLEAASQEDSVFTSP